MKKIVFASMMALASVSLVSSLMLRAQDSLTIKDPAEFNTYDMACGNCASHPEQTSSAILAKASGPGLESFLTAYPQSIVKKAVLDLLLDKYYTPAPAGLGDNDKALSAASRLLQLEPGNLKAILYSVFIKKGQCGKTQDAQTCDDAAALARKGLAAPKPAGIADPDWKNQTTGSYPVFHSAIAFDDAAIHKDFKGAEDEYTQELMGYTDDQAKTNGLQDTYLLAMAYTQPGVAKDLVKAIWFYARVWNFVPAPKKPSIEKALEYWYTKYHGNLKGLDDIKAKAALTTFPGDMVIEAAPTPAQIAHTALTGGDPASLNLGDKEFILANGSKEDADKLWSIMKDQATPVPGTVISAPASAIKVSVTQGVKPTEYLVKLATPVEFSSFKAPDATDLKGQQDFILANGVKVDTAKLSDLFADPKTPIKKIVIDPVATAINIAVTADAKTSKTADFIVNLKTPISGKEAPAAGIEYGIATEGKLAELDGTYDTYKQIAATDTTQPSAQIVLRDGSIHAAEKNKPAGAAHKPAAAHHAVKH